MENEFYKNPMESVNENRMPMNVFKAAGELYFEDLMKKNIGKIANLYVTIPGSNEYRDKVFSGTIEGVGPDYTIVSNPTNGHWYLILTVYLDYITFEETIAF